LSMVSDGLMQASVDRIISRAVLLSINFPFDVWIYNISLTQISAIIAINANNT
jgi:hypothetical protein